MSTPDVPGWYDDPDDATQLRYFDGIVWSDRRVPRRVERPAPTPPVEGGAARSGGPSVDVYGRPASPAPRAGSQLQPGRVDTGYERYGHESYAKTGPSAATTEDGQPLASYGMRVLAWMIDFVVVSILTMITAGWAFWLFSRDYWAFIWEVAESGDQERIDALQPEDLIGYFDWPWYFAGMAISLVVFAAYHSLMVGLRGGGVGKLVTGLRVRRVDQPGPPGVGVGFMRVLLPLTLGVLSALPLLSLLVPFVGLAALLSPAWDAKRQAWHDKIAKTQVVENR